MASVLEGFLVKLGFSVDKDGLKKFNNSVEETNIRFKSIAKGALAVGTAVRPLSLNPFTTQISFTLNRVTWVRP